jgi:SAM-dependent methyltransferase
MTARHEPDLLHCAACGYWRSLFVEPNAISARPLDEARRYAALSGIRRRSARIILRTLAEHRTLAGARLCDIGCGYGWFVAEAQALGVQALGIEPDEPVAEHSLRQGLNVRVGQFPDCLRADERFDLMTFNDVLEHLSDFTGAIDACRVHLAPGGLLSIAIPSSGGALFRAAGALRRLGLRGPLDRLWQRGFPSPHRHYFDRRNLERLLVESGFELLSSQALPAFDLRGLWDRLQMDGARPRWQLLWVWAALAGAYPLLRLLPLDILLQIYRAPERAAR